MESIIEDIQNLVDNLEDSTKDIENLVNKVDDSIKEDNVIISGFRVRYDIMNMNI